MPESQRIGKNILLDIQGDVLTLTIDLSKNFGSSKSGKSTIIATTSGNQEVADSTYLGLNLYTK